MPGHSGIAKTCNTDDLTRKGTSVSLTTEQFVIMRAKYSKDKDTTHKKNQYRSGKKCFSLSARRLIFCT